MSGWGVEHTTLAIVRGFITPEEVEAWEIVAEGETVAYIPDTGEGYQRERADLMAAAPELAAALEALFRGIDTQLHGGRAAGYLQHVQDARDALRKAGRLP